MQARADDLLFFLLFAIILLSGSGSTLALDTARTASTIRRRQGEVNMFLGVKTNDERGDVNNLFANPIMTMVELPSHKVRSKRYEPDVSLPDESPRMVNAFRQTALEHLGLQPSLQEIFDFEGQHVIETHA